MYFVVIWYSSPGRLTHLANPEMLALNHYMIFSPERESGDGGQQDGSAGKQVVS